MHALLLTVALVTGLLLNGQAVMMMFDWHLRRERAKAARAAALTAPKPQPGLEIPSVPGWRDSGVLMAAGMASLGYTFAFLVSYVLGTMPT